MTEGDVEECLKAAKRECLSESSFMDLRNEVAVDLRHLDLGEGYPRCASRGLPMRGDAHLVASLRRPSHRGEDHLSTKREKSKKVSPTLA